MAKFVKIPVCQLIRVQGSKVFKVINPSILVVNVDTVESVASSLYVNKVNGIAAIPEDDVESVVWTTDREGPLYSPASIDVIQDILNGDVVL